MWLYAQIDDLLDQLGDVAGHMHDQVSTQSTMLHQMEERIDKSSEAQAQVNVRMKHQLKHT